MKKIVLVTLWIGFAFAVSPQISYAADSCCLNNTTGALTVRSSCTSGTESTLPITSCNTIEGLISRILRVVSAAVPFIIGLTLLAIIWGIFNYIRHSAEEEKRIEARQFVVYGIIGMFIMVSVWGFVNVLISTFDLDRTVDSSDIPKVPTLVP